MHLSFGVLALGSLALANAASHGLLDNPRHKAYVDKRDRVLAPTPSRRMLKARQATTTTTQAGVPPLSQITAKAPVEPPVPLFTQFPAGAPAPYSAAPPLPTVNINPANYPALDITPPLNSTQVQQWLSEIDLSGVPNLAVTKDGSCESDPQFAADTTRCWWTCGGCTRPTDVTTCPTKLDWGVSYDDGPSDYTPKLVNYLHGNNLTATFYVVGSRVVSRPEILQTEYMLGHEIADHTWSHTALTTLTNEQIVAELGWTRQAIKDVIGVSPRFCRPPYGDIDDRVRAVMKAMDLIPVIWTGSGDTEFDTDDWMIPGGTANGTSSFAAWQSIVAQAVNLTTGFIVLQHDLFQQTVDMAVDYILPDALSHQPAFHLKSIIQCQNQPSSNSYAETYSNSTGTNAITTSASSSAPASSSSVSSRSRGQSGDHRSGSISIRGGSMWTLVIGSLIGFAVTLLL